MYLGSVSKTHAPALRTGWLVVAAGLADAILREKAHDDNGTPVLEQLALARLLARGEIDRHIRRSRLVYRGVATRCSPRSREQLPEATPERGRGRACTSCSTCPAGPRRRAVAEAAARRDVAVVPLSQHRVAPRGPALILGYGQLAEPAIDAAVAALAAAIRSSSVSARAGVPAPAVPLESLLGGDQLQHLLHG